MAKGQTLLDLVKGGEIKKGGIHLLGTPDTIELVLNVAKKLQAILDLCYEQSPTLYKKEVVTLEKLKSYKTFSVGETCPNPKVPFNKRHVYVFSDPSGDWQPEMDPKLFDKVKECKDIESLKLLLKKEYKRVTYSDKYLHDLLLLQTVNRFSKETANFVQLNLGFARQDIGTSGEMQPTSLGFFADIISGLVGDKGVVMTLDVHNKAAAMASFGKIGDNYKNLRTGWLIEDCIKNLGLENPVLCATDSGGGKKVKKIAKDLGIESIMAEKVRDDKKHLSSSSQADSISDVDIYGDVEGKDILIYDDMMDTCGTMIAVIKELLKRKPRSINIVSSHGMFNGNAYSELNKVINESNGIVQYVFISNSINKECPYPWLKVIDASTLIANNIIQKYKDIIEPRIDNNDKPVNFKNDNYPYHLGETQ